VVVDGTVVVSEDGIDVIVVVQGMEEKVAEVGVVVDVVVVLVTVAVVDSPVQPKMDTMIVSSNNANSLFLMLITFR